jgi:hypothetical protein
MRAAQDREEPSKTVSEKQLTQRPPMSGAIIETVRGASKASSIPVQRALSQRPCWRAMLARNRN